MSLWKLIFNGLIHALVSSCPLWKLAKKKVTMNEDWIRIEHKGEGVSSHTSKMQPQRGSSPNNCNIPSKNFDWSMFSLVRVRNYSWYLTIICKWEDTQSGTGLLNEVYWRISTKKIWKVSLTGWYHRKSLNDLIRYMSTCVLFISKQGTACKRLPFSFVYSVNISSRTYNTFKSLKSRIWNLLWSQTRHYPYPSLSPSSSYHFQFSCSKFAIWISKQ